MKKRFGGERKSVVGLKGWWKKVMLLEKGVKGMQVRTWRI